ncbi:hypothetical protein EDC01DRAFT_760849 [Geopyxis carbonaria]|nr:hypothetical protein EDC01DRAFT_760849 [Geopyxis carbonaria]
MSYQLKIDIHKTLATRYACASAASAAAEAYVSSFEKTTPAPPATTAADPAIKSEPLPTATDPVIKSEPGISPLPTATAPGADLAMAVRPDRPGSVFPSFTRTSTSAAADVAARAPPYVLAGTFDDGTRLTVRVLRAVQAVVRPVSTAGDVKIKTEAGAGAGAGTVYLLMAAEDGEGEMLSAHRTKHGAERALEAMLRSEQWHHKVEVRRGREGVYGVKLLMREGDVYSEEVVARVVEMVFAD